ncbi:hypothetical protein [Pyrococcus horikoshii]|nr:hypothetical protein [Pyrococcus horikoshii]HII61000.1 hypothetical protein [Pyrococcus horikoshii]
MVLLEEVEAILEKTKLRLIIQEKAKISEAKVFDLIVLGRDNNMIGLVLLNRKPKKYSFNSSFNLKLYYLWKDRNKLYVQETTTNEVIPLEIEELDAFIDLILGTSR